MNLDVSSIAFSVQYWLETSMNGQTLAPRTRLTSAPYALHADTAEYARAAAGSICNYTIGQNVPALGGYIFFFDGSGCHGLVCAPTDQSTGIQWYNDSYVEDNIPQSGIGIGRGNTQTIVLVQGPGPYAAYLCDTLTIGGYHDWYLPSAYELNLMWLNVGQGSTNVGAFSAVAYWSSTEWDLGNAQKEDFSTGLLRPDNEPSPYYVRAIRTF